MSGGGHRAAGRADHRLRRARAVRDVRTRWRSPRSPSPGRRPAREPVSRWACSAPSPGARRCARDRARAGPEGGRHLRPVRDHGPRASPASARADGLHGWEDHFLFEVIDPETGSRARRRRGRRAGHHHAHQRALPMLRYRTRDITRITDALRCGRTRTCASCASGRNDDMLIIRGVNVYPSQIEGRAGRPPGHRATTSWCDAHERRGRTRPGRGPAEASTPVCRSRWSASKRTRAPTCDARAPRSRQSLLAASASVPPGQAGGAWRPGSGARPANSCPTYHRRRMLGKGSAACSTNRRRRPAFAWDA